MSSEKESSIALDTLRHASILGTTGVAILGAVGLCVALRVGYNTESQVDDKKPVETTCLISNTDTIPNDLPYLDCER